jgi:hypothetical protein
MEVEIHFDRIAYRHHRRSMFLFALATVLFMPAVLLVLYSLATMLGRETVKPYTGAACVGGFLVVLATFFYGIRHSFAYRCPRCGRRLPRVVPLDQSRPNIHFHCVECHVVWDLGWHQGKNA